MKNKDNRLEQGVPPAISGQVLRGLAEDTAREKAGQPQENLEAMPPEETQQMLHELLVYHIELKMQNEELRRAHVELDAARVRYFNLYDLAPVGYCTVSEDGLILEANLTAANLLGVAQSVLIKQPLSRFILKEDQGHYYLHRKQLFETGELQACELRMVKMDGTEFWVHLAATAVQNADDAPVCRVVLSDITERKRLETALSQEKKLLETTLISIGDGVISTDNKGNVMFLNRVAESLTGWTQEAARGKAIEEVFNIVNEFTRKKSENIVRKAIEIRKINKLANCTILISKDGIERPIENSAAPIVKENGEIDGVVLVFRDFSERKQKQEEIEFLSYHDQLTGLYNRRFYEEELKRLDTERNLPLTIAMGDVNGLKLINDSFGHVLGDELLKKVAEVIKRGCRVDDIIARLGGDEFVFILPKSNATETEKVIKRIKDLLLKEKVGSMGISISISFGYETKNNKEENIQEIFKKTEDHMYRHKLSESLSMRSKTIDMIMNTLYEKNNREMLHSKRVGEICENIAAKMNFDKDYVNQIRIAGLMHDIGKIGIDEKILNNPQKLNYDEWKEIKRHSEIGYRILSSANEFSEIADYVLEHQEKWDGKGYPRGLKGEEISLQAKIITVADAFDAMTSDRAYSKALSEEEAINEIRRCSGIQFDPIIAKVFIKEVLGKEF